MKRGQKGFTVVETLLVLILLSIVGFTGYYVYHSRNNANSTYNNATNSASSTPKSNTSTSNQDTSAAEQTVKDFYAAYIQAASDQDTTHNRQPTTDVVAKYGTQNLVSAFSATQTHDPILCGQNTVESISILNSSTGASGLITVNISRKDYGDTNASHPSVVVANGKIDSVACPTSN